MAGNNGDGNRGWYKKSDSKTQDADGLTCDEHLCDINEYIYNILYSNI